MSDTECPYCGGEIEICHDLGECYAEDELHEKECCHCEKTFVFTTEIHFTHKTKKADCLNGGEHTLERTKTYPPQYARLECTQCGMQKPLTVDRISSDGP